MYAILNSILCIRKEIVMLNIISSEPYESRIIQSRPLISKMKSAIG
jgi:hypothetical protein